MQRIWRVAKEAALAKTAEAALQPVFADLCVCRQAFQL
jgi:hypothetical protein